MPWVSLGRGGRVNVMPHAVQRYAERVLAGAVETDQALAHMRRLAMQVGTWGGEPAWAHRRPLDDGEPALGSRADRFVLLGPDIALPVMGERAVTCIVRGCVSDVTRAERKRRRQARQHRRRYGKQLERQHRGRPDEREAA